MAMKLNAGAYSRSELYSIFPDDIVVHPEENSRAAPVAQEAVEALAASILEYGQLEPVLVRRIEDQKVQLVAGYTRHRAISHINTWLRPEQPMKIQCRVMDLNSEEAFLRNLVENRDRCDTTPIDDAAAQRRLREQYGWSEAKIAEFYGKSVSYIYQLKKTLQLSEPIKEEVAEGNISIGAALDLTELPESQREAVVEEAKNPETGKVDSDKVREKVRQHKEVNGSGSKARTLKNLKIFFDEQTGPGEREAVRGLCRKFLDYVSGKISDAQMVNAMQKFCKD